MLWSWLLYLNSPYGRSRSNRESFLDRPRCVHVFAVSAGIERITPRNGNDVAGQNRRVLEQAGQRISRVARSIVRSASSVHRGSVS